MIQALNTRLAREIAEKDKLRILNESKTEELEEMESIISKLKCEVEEIKTRAEKLSVKLEGDVKEKEELIQNLKTSINDLKWKSESLQLEKEALEKKLEDKENEACQMRSEVETIKTSSEQKLKELSDTTNSRAEARALAMSKTLENKLKEKENECDQKLKQIKELVNTRDKVLPRLTSMINESKSKIKTQEKDNEFLKLTNENLKVQLRNTNQELSKAKETICTIQKIRDDLVKENKRLEAKIDHLNERFVIKPSTLQLAKEAQEKDEVETKDEEIKQLKAKIENFVKNKDEEIKKLKDKLAHFQRDPLNLEDKVVTDSDLEEYKKKVDHQEKALNIATSKITGLEYHIGKKN